MLSQLSSDILYLIGSHLDPVSTVKYLRLSKGFHRLDNSYFWKLKYQKINKDNRENLDYRREYLNFAAEQFESRASTSNSRLYQDLEYRTLQKKLHEIEIKYERERAADHLMYSRLKVDSIIETWVPSFFEISISREEIYFPINFLLWFREKRNIDVIPGSLFKLSVVNEDKFFIFIYSMFNKHLNYEVFKSPSYSNVFRSYLYYLGCPRSLIEIYRVNREEFAIKKNDLFSRNDSLNNMYRELSK